MKEYRLGIDIGGTAIKVGVIDGDGHVAEKSSFPTSRDILPDGNYRVIDDIIKVCLTMTAKYDISSVGVGCPGAKDDTGTVIVRAGNLPFKNFPIVTVLERALGKEVYMDNDGNSALVAEWLFADGGVCEDMIAVTIGTGIGGGAIVGGDLLRGKSNNAGEFGHFVIDPTGNECPCGQKGCFEQFASATALVDMCRKSAKEHPDSILARVGNEKGFSGRTPFYALKGECPVAYSVLTEYGKHLAAGINGLCWIFAPERVVLCGGISKEGEELLRFVRPHLSFPERVETSKLGGDAGIIGAACLDVFKDYYRHLRKLN